MRKNMFFLGIGAVLFLAGCDAHNSAPAQHQPAPYVMPHKVSTSCTRHGGTVNDTCCSDEDCSGQLSCIGDLHHAGHCKMDPDPVLRAPLQSPSQTSAVL